jgi:hypothetical protein
MSVVFLLEKILDYYHKICHGRFLALSFQTIIYNTIALPFVTIHAIEMRRTILIGQDKEQKEKRKEEKKTPRKTKKR